MFNQLLLVKNNDFFVLINPDSYREVKMFCYYQVGFCPVPKLRDSRLVTLRMILKEVEKIPRLFCRSRKRPLRFEKWLLAFKYLFEPLLERVSIHRENTRNLLLSNVYLRYDNVQIACNFLFFQ